MVEAATVGSTLARWARESTRVAASERRRLAIVDITFPHVGLLHPGLRRHRSPTGLDGTSRRGPKCSDSTSSPTGGSSSAAKRSGGFVSSPRTPSTYSFSPCSSPCPADRPPTKSTHRLGARDTRRGLPPHPRDHVHVRSCLRGHLKAGLWPVRPFVHFVVFALLGAQTPGKCWSHAVRDRSLRGGGNIQRRSGELIFFLEERDQLGGRERSSDTRTPSSSPALIVLAFRSRCIKLGRFQRSVPPLRPPAGDERPRFEPAQAAFVALAAVPCTCP